MQQVTQARATEARKVEEQDAQSELAKYGFIQDWSVRFLDWKWILVIGVAIFAAGLAANAWIVRVTDKGITGANLMTVLFALLAAIVGYQQWRASRQETSLDRFYDRLKLTNDRLNEWVAARMMLNGAIIAKDADETEDDKQKWRRMMYVFIELDNLEYAIEKYKIGYMRPELARRALRTFRLRCASAEFRELAHGRVSNTKNLEYTETTREVVRRVCDAPALSASEASRGMPSSVAGG